MFFAGYKGYDNPAIDWYEEEQIARHNPLEQQAQAWGRVYRLDDFARAHNAVKRDKAIKAFNDLQDLTDGLDFSEAELTKKFLDLAFTELEFVIMRLEG